GLEIPGFDPATFDPSPFDPSTLDLSGVDTENLDLSSLVPEPVSTHGRIGSAGGSLSVTGKNGIIYTLDVPPDALDFALYFTLTPVAEIDGYPFSGGYLGAVDIQPEGIIFDTPVMLTITFPEELIAAQPTDPEIVQMAFAYERGGEEFHLTPLAPDSVAAAQNTPDGAGKLASPNVKGPTLILNIPMNRTQGVGGGNAKPREMRNHASNNPTTDEANRTDQNSAAKQVDDYLAPLIDDDLANLVDAENAIKDAQHQKAMRRGAEIVEKMKKATDIQKLTMALVSFQGFYYTGEYYRLLPEEQKYMFDTAAVLLKNWLQPEKCPSPEAAHIQAWTRRLAKPVSIFDLTLKERMAANYGAVAVNELLRDIASVQGCKVKLVLKSTVIMSDKDHICRYRMKVTAEVPLSWKNFGSGEAFLQGGPPEKVFNLKYTLPFDFYYEQKIEKDRCSLVEVGGLDKSEFIVLRLAPSFNRVTQAGESDHPDWGPLIYKVGGDADKLTMTFESWGFDNGYYAEYHTETRPIPNLGGDRDMWGGSMALMATNGTGGWIGDHDWVLSDAGQGGQIAHWTGKGAYVDIANNHEHDTTLSLEPQ
ncbi:MAG: hypothetical protein MUO19_00100, partial [Dehalococcoidales bacterium]|nr:hypothetical protein [Dehalococcoidales bacterium]